MSQNKPSINNPSATNLYGNPASGKTAIEKVKPIVENKAITHGVHPYVSKPNTYANPDRNDPLPSLPVNSTNPLEIFHINALKAAIIIFSKILMITKYNP